MPKRTYPAARQLAASEAPPTVKPILAGIKIDKAHEADDHRIKSKTMRQHRNCIKSIIAWIDANYPEYWKAGGIHVLTKTQLNDHAVHHFKNTDHLEYERLNVSIILAFFADHKILTRGMKKGKF
jgi:hypothetical protein